MAIDPTTTALVLIEYQNDFTSEGGVLHGAVSEVMDKTDMLANTRASSPRRAAGATVMHAPITFAAGYGELSSHPYGILKGVVDGNAFVKGSWGAAIVDELAPAEGDIVIEGKRGLDTFASTNLDFILRSKGITTLVLGGFLTNCCVESTMRSGYENGYQVITLTDCVAATSAEEHENALKYDFPMFSQPMTSDGVHRGARREHIRIVSGAAAVSHVEVPGGRLAVHRLAGDQGSPRTLIAAHGITANGLRWPRWPGRCRTGSGCWHRICVVVRRAATSPGRGGSGLTLTI